MFGFFSKLCSGRKPTPVEAELRRQRLALKSISKFVSSIQRCLKYWDRSGKSLRIGITGYFYDKPAYQQPVDEITAALDSFKTISASLKPQLEIIKKANVAAEKSIERVEKVNKRKREAEKRVFKKEGALRKLQKKLQSGKDPQAGMKVKAAEDELQLAKNNLQLAEAELSREMQQTMNGVVPEAAMQVARATEAMIIFLVGSGVDPVAIRASIKTLQETQYFSPLSAAGQQQQHSMQLLNSMNSKRDRDAAASGSRGSTSPADPQRALSHHSSRIHTPTESQQNTPRLHHESADTTNHNNVNEPLLSSSPTNPFASE